METFVYKFEDGTFLRLLDRELSIGEALALQKIHGSSYIEFTKMKIHQLTILDCDADEIIAGNKMFALRNNDYQKGDYICFTVLSKESGKVVRHAINERMYEIEFVIGGFKGGFVALGIREVNNDAD